MVECSAVAIFKTLNNFEQECPHVGFALGPTNNGACLDSLHRILTISLCTSSMQQMLLANKWEFPLSSSREGQGHLCTSLDLGKHVNISQGSRGRGELNNDLA